jgi:hypothetical protein
MSEDAMAALREEVVGRGKARAARRPDGYRRQRELLQDLRLLHNHYQKRSEMVFEPARWDGLQRPADGAPATSRRIEELWSEIRSRILRSPAARDFPIVRLLREHRLGDAETMIVVHLLFREIHSGEAFADVADLLRLVSTDDADLLRARCLVRKEAPLVRDRILVLEPYVENRELTAEARLEDWVVTRVLTDGEAGEAIAADERLRWHEYLRGLDDSGGFFRDLDA